MVALAALLVSLAPSAATASPGETWQALRSQDGLVILYRHAIAPGGGDPPGFRLGDCATQRNLSAQGRAQARRIGAELREARVPIALVRSSRWCRALDTARLMAVGTVRPTPALDSVFTAPADRAERQRRATERLIRAHRDADGVLVLVGHQANIIDLTGVAPQSGEGVVVRAGADGRIEVVGRLPAPPG
jgi:phosphohistidine phosphatase SixA